MAHVGGQLEAQFMAGVRGCDRARCLVVRVDVGKAIAMVPDTSQAPAPLVASTEKTTGLPACPPVADRVAEPPTEPEAGAEGHEQASAEPDNALR